MFGRTPPFRASNPLQDEADAAALALFTAAKKLIWSSYAHPNGTGRGRGPNICVNGFDLDTLKKAVVNAEKYAASEEPPC